MKIKKILLPALFIALCGCTEISSEVKKTDMVNAKASTSENVQTTVLETEPTVLQETVAVTETEPSLVIPYELEEIFEDNGYTKEDISDTEQLIVVECDDTNCVVSMYELENNQWEEKYYTDGIIGKDGASYDDNEYNCHTPMGLFSLGFAFGMEELTDLDIEYRQVNENCYWIDDGDSELYNQWVESDDITWNSAEHLIEYPEEYKYAVVIESNNDPIVPYGGSAIFLHCNNFEYTYTLGCVAIATEDMYNILCMLDDSANPKIMIV